MKFVVILAVSVAISLLITYGDAHSWLGCADYASESDTEWSAAKCRGYGRNFFQNGQAATFGGDGGYDFQGQNCRVARTGANVDAFYTAQYPMATYYQGQRVCLAWPAKNHVAAPCTNANIEDRGFNLYVSGVNPTTDPTSAQFKQNPITPFGNGQHVNGQIDFKGFQNCSKFCEQGMDRAFCNGCFDVPASFEVGQYTFQWWWEFNGGQIYSNCFDVDVKAASECPYTDGTCGGGADAINGGKGKGSGKLSGGAKFGIAIVIIAVVVVAVAVGLIFLKKKQPDTFDKLASPIKKITSKV